MLAGEKRALEGVQEMIGFGAERISLPRLSSGSG